MEDISLHIMDIVENALRAGAGNISVSMVEKENRLTLVVEDDGPGMDETMLQRAQNPFFTTKEGKRFGLGLSLLSQACEETGGSMNVGKSEAGGVKVTCVFHTDNVDMKPLGKIKKTIRILQASHPEVTINFQPMGTDVGKQQAALQPQ